MSSEAGAKDDNIELSRSRRRLGGAKKSSDQRRDRGRDADAGDQAPAEPRSRTPQRLRGKGAKQSSSQSNGNEATEEPTDAPAAGADQSAEAGAKPEGGSDAEAEGGEGSSSFFGKVTGGLKGLRTRFGSPDKKNGNKAGGEGEGEGKPNDEDAENTDLDAGGKNILGLSAKLQPIRADPIKSFTVRAKRLERLTTQRLPEVHVVGEIKSGSGFIESVTEGAMCRFKIDCGEAFSVVGGNILGQTQFSYCKLDVSEELSFNHPIDLHFSQTAIQSGGMPRITLQVYKLDLHGRRIMCGYGFTHIPVTCGAHTMEVDIWRPSGTFEQELSASFIGDVPALASPAPIYDNAWKERSRIISRGSGKVRLELFIMTRFYESHSMDGMGR